MAEETPLGEASFADELPADEHVPEAISHDAMPVEETALEEVSLDESSHEQPETHA